MTACHSAFILAMVISSAYSFEAVAPISSSWSTILCSPASIMSARLVSGPRTTSTPPLASPISFQCRSLRPGLQSVWRMGRWTRNFSILARTVSEMRRAAG